MAIDIDKKAKRITIAVHDPFAPTAWIDEIKRTTDLDVDLRGRDPRATSRR